MLHLPHSFSTFICPTPNLKQKEANVECIIYYSRILNKTQGEKEKAYIYG